ncbi:MmgE/PrpD family 2-methylcitrate dehydratase protein [Rhizobium gallicum bv. gallicum R602sp]|uniref:MmgE/PrpD family 2-methylcitrate dehydratase protein n=1 Tax=Rhizobium gallicum bv. gallicum R602sp TaxID=1041138 RepID=A0A0B4X5I3_9HYPH|nr:MmgE/PrpD family protein [Rhizobium gallicum]AJD42406.1 MmgE/PrpD family 2-methylcitrate dehydratase protein [Rhizobium gallicum bv. gallicum R602sp]
MPPSITQTIGEYIGEESFSRLPPEVIHKSKLCIMDSIGCLFGARNLPVSRMMDSFLTDNYAAGPGVRLLDPGMSAFRKASLINALDFDDIYEKGHPGATVIAAALSMTAHRECSGADFLEAVVVGYEVSCRVGISLLHRTPRKTLHGHGTWQTFGATAAAAKLMRLDAGQAAQAIAIAAANAPVASVMKTVYGKAPSMAKNNFGAAAQTGVNAARLAAAGFEGPLDIFEGQTGFWRMAGADDCDFGRLTRSFGSIYEISKVGFKPFSCCRLIQNSVQACRDVFTMAGIDAAASERIKLGVTAPPIVCEPPFSTVRPKDMWAAQFSAPHAIAMAVLGVEPGPDWFAEDWLRHDIAGSLQDIIEFMPRSARDLFREPHAASACLHLHDGRVLEKYVPLADGEAANPMQESALETKFLRLASPTVGDKASLELLDRLQNLKSATSVQPLVRFVSGSMSTAA